MRLLLGRQEQVPPLIPASVRFPARWFQTVCVCFRFSCLVLFFFCFFYSLGYVVESAAQKLTRQRAIHRVGVFLLVVAQGLLGHCRTASSFAQVEASSEGAPHPPNRTCVLCGFVTFDTSV